VGKESQERERKAKESAENVPGTERLDSTRATRQRGRIYEDRRTCGPSLDGAELER
jgi:hypothetical protein